MARDGIRRAAGTKRVSDLVLHWDQLVRLLCDLPATDPAIDLRDFAEGRPLRVVAICETDRPRRIGALILDSRAADPILWFPRRLLRRAAGPGVPMRAPIEIERVSGLSGTARRVEQFREIEARAGGQAWTVSVPAVDLELVIAAIAQANRSTREAPSASPESSR